MKRENDDYTDIINLPHHVSEIHPPMSLYNRAAQFSPFAALTGYEEQVDEVARFTLCRPELSSDEKELLNEKLRILESCLCDTPSVSVTYFLPDKLKSGGAYMVHRGKVKKIDIYLEKLVFCDKNGISSRTEIPFDSIISIESDVFQLYGIT